MHSNDSRNDCEPISESKFHSATEVKEKMLKHSAEMRNRFELGFWGTQINGDRRLFSH